MPKIVDIFIPLKGFLSANDISNPTGTIAIRYIAKPKSHPAV
jgi:hypothetical protein